MTILHVIKYQLSNPPTEEELAALPPEIIILWCNKVIANISSQKTPLVIASIFKAFHRVEDKSHYQELRQGLIHLLQEYDE